MTFLRGIAAACAAGLVVLFQLSLIAVPTIADADFDRSADELTRTSRWRYGYIVQNHGAVLLKARLAVESPPLPPAPGGRLSILMARELRLRPWKAAFELAFYAALFGLSRVRRRFLTRVRAHRDGKFRRAAGAALFTVLLVTATMLPYLVLGYGEPLFSTHQGPGALSYSGLVSSTGGLNTPAVSYGILLQAVLIGPFMCTQWAAEPLSAWLGTGGSLWFVAVCFWGVVASAVRSLGASIVSDRRGAENAAGYQP